MTRQESIDEIRALILDLEKYLTSPIQGVRYRAKKQYAGLINRFFRENKNFLAQQQSLACLDDIQYFMSLLQAAEDYYNCESMEQTPSVINKTPLFPSNADFNQISSVWAKCRYWQDMFTQVAGSTFHNWAADFSFSLNLQQLTYQQGSITVAAYPFSKLTI